MKTDNDELTAQQKKYAWKVISDPVLSPAVFSALTSGNGKSKSCVQSRAAAEPLSRRAME
jgi:hypothetical protein